MKEMSWQFLATSASWISSHTAFLMTCSTIGSGSWNAIDWSLHSYFSINSIMEGIQDFPRHTSLYYQENSHYLHCWLPIEISEIKRKEEVWGLGEGEVGMGVNKIKYTKREDYLAKLSSYHSERFCSVKQGTCKRQELLMLLWGRSFGHGTCIWAEPNLK